MADPEVRRCTILNQSHNPIAGRRYTARGGTCVASLKSRKSLPYRRCDGHSGGSSTALLPNYYRAGETPLSGLIDVSVGAAPGLSDVD